KARAGGQHAFHHAAGAHRRRDHVMRQDRSGRDPRADRRAPKFGLEPYLVRNESVGFIFNRIWAAIKRESLAVVAEEVSTPEEVDAIFKRMLGVPNGPFRLMDAVGLDVVLDIEEHYAALRAGIPEGPSAKVFSAEKPGGAFISTNCRMGRAKRNPSIGGFHAA